MQQAAGSFEAILLKLDEERREVEAERDNSKHEIDAQRAKESQAVTSLSSAEQEAESLREQASIASPQLFHTLNNDVAWSGKQIRLEYWQS